MAEMLKSNNDVNILEFKDGQPTEIISNTTTIMQSILPNSVRPEIKINPSSKIVFWTLFHYNLIPNFMPIRGLRHIHLKSRIFNTIDSFIKKEYYNNLSEFVCELNKKSSIFFMDRSTFEITDKYLNLNINNPMILPICIDTTPEPPPYNQKQNNSEFNICWIGRVEDFKTSILQYSIKQALAYGKKYKHKIKFSIIGYGKDLYKIKNIKHESDFFVLDFVGTMNNKDLDHFLIERVDLLISMGTAALEGGKLGIPTVLLDASYDAIPDGYKFRWLYESDGSNVARFIDPDKILFEGYTIKEIISELDNHRDDIGAKCFNYVRKNHRTEVIASKLINNIKEADFEWGDINQKLLQKHIIRKMYDRYRFQS